MSATNTTGTVQRNGVVEGVRWDADCIQIPGGRYLIKKIQVWLSDEKAVCIHNHRESAKDDAELERTLKRVVEKVIKRKPA
ncbi:MAG: hypothetical protein ABI411_00020 [Tahibacter sp.]